MATNFNQIATSSTLIKETASITWVLDNFTNLTSYHFSSNFTPQNNSKLTFQLGVWLKASPFTDNVFIYLYPNQTNEKLHLEYEVSILDSQNKKCYTRMFHYYYDKNLDYCYCFASLMSYQKLINEANGFIPGNKWKLFCEVKILNRKLDVIKQPEATGLILSKLSKDFQTIFENGDYSDFTLIVGDKEFKVHKAIIGSRSSVFKAMFSADLKEKKQNRVEISDIDVEVFEQLLAYIYSGVAPKMNEYALDLFVAADKYQLDELKTLIGEFLISSISIETVANILLHADMHSAVELKSKCIKFVTANSNKVMATDGWKQLLKTNRMQLMAELYADKCSN